MVFLKLVCAQVDAGYGTEYSLTRGDPYRPALRQKPEIQINSPPARPGSCRPGPKAPTLAVKMKATRGGTDPMFFGQIEGTDLVVLDKRFKPLFAGYAQVERLWTGARWSEGPAWFGPWPLSHLVGHPQQPHAALRRAVGRGLGVSRAVQQLERQHGRQPGTARHLRAPDAPRDAHRSRRVDLGRRRQMAGQAAQLTQRRGRQIGQFHLVHRSRLRHR